MDTDFLLEPLGKVWAVVVSTIPALLSAIVILVIGLLVATILSRVVRKFIMTIKGDELVSRFSIFRKAQEAGWQIRPSHILASIVKWFFIIVTLMAASEQLGLITISNFLLSIVVFIPQVVVAIVLLAVGFVLGQFVHDIVKQSLKSSKAGAEAVKVTPLVAKYAIIVFAAIAAANQLEIAETLNTTFFTAVMAAISLALGLAFGLGGKEHASRILDRLQK